MSVLSLGVAALTAVSLVAPSRPAAPQVTRYRINQVTEQEVDLSGMGQPKQTNRFSTSTFLTVTLGDTSGGKTLHVVVDSMVPDSGTALPAQLKASMDSLKGSAYHGYLSRGKVSGLKAMKDGGDPGALAGVIHAIFPSIKPGVKVGDNWVDTTDTKSDQDGNSMTVRTVATYKAAGNEQHSGTKALRLDATTASSMNGQQMTQSGPATIDGTGSGTGTYYVAPDGRLLDGSAVSNTQLSFAIAQAPTPIPVTTKQTTTITTLK